MTARFTDAEKADCARREVKQRERVYPRLIETGKLTPGFAQRQIDLMIEIAEDYEAKAKAERLV